MTGFVPNNNIVTIADYLQEYSRATQALREAENPRTRKQLMAYCRKIGKEIKEFDLHRGTNYGKHIEI